MSNRNRYRKTQFSGSNVAYLPLMHCSFCVFEKQEDPMRQTLIDCIVLSIKTASWGWRRANLCLCAGEGGNASNDTLTAESTREMRTGSDSYSNRNALGK